MEIELLLKAPLFKGLDIAEISALLKITPHKVKRYSPGSLVAQSGDTVGRLMVVTRGTVKGEMVDYAGRVIKIEDIPAPGALASAFMFGNKNRFPVNVISLTDTEILVIEREDFLRMLMRDSRILINFLDMISSRSQFLSEKIKFLNFKTIKGKLAQFILQRAGETKNEIRLDMTQSDLADFFGVARPSVARALGEMEDGGLIIASGKLIRITGREGLSRLIFD
jgi:CRP-like cAMP-binding protein